MNAAEITNHLIRLNEILRQINDKVFQNPKPQPDLDELWDRVLNLGAVLKTACNRDRVQQEIQAQFGFTAFAPPEEVETAWVIFKHPTQMLSMAEAQRFRNIFMGLGMTLFYVEFGVNNRVKSFEDPVNVEQAFKDRYTGFNIKVSSTFIHFVSPKTPELTQEAAQAFYNELVDTYPQVFWRVRYGPTNSSIIKDYVTNSRQMRLEPLPSNPTPEQQEAWLKRMYNYDNDDWEADPGPDPHDTNL